VAGLIIGAVAWLLIGGVISVVPYFGPLLAFGSFALVIALAATCLILWVMGMFNAVRGRGRTLRYSAIERSGCWAGNAASRRAHRIVQGRRLREPRRDVTEIGRRFRHPGPRQHTGNLTTAKQLAARRPDGSGAPDGRANRCRRGTL